MNRDIKAHHHTHECMRVRLDPYKKALHREMKNLRKRVLEQTVWKRRKTITREYNPNEYNPNEYDPNEYKPNEYKPNEYNHDEYNPCNAVISPNHLYKQENFDDTREQEEYDELIAHIHAREREREHAHTRMIKWRKNKLLASIVVIGVAIGVVIGTSLWWHSRSY